MAKRPERNAGRELQEVRVRLKPLLGLQPGTYLTILYAFGLLLLLFFLLLYPGIRFPGTQVQVRTYPSGAEALVDGVYAGSTPCRLLVPGGKHRITLRKPFYRSIELESAFSKRIFATLFLPPRKSIKQKLEIQDLTGLMGFIRQDFIANPHIPEILMEISRAGFSASQPEKKNELFDLLNNLMLYVQEPAQAGAFMYAFSSLETGAQALTPKSLITIVGKIIQLKEDNQYFPLWLVSISPENLASVARKNPWFSSYLDSYQARYQAFISGSGNPAFMPQPGSPIYIAGVSFRPVPGGSFLMGKDDVPKAEIGPLLPHPAKVSSLYLSESEISKSQYRRFLEENPFWKKDNLEELVRQGLVTDAYLQDWPAHGLSPEQEALPVVNVSHPAATAFCSWISSRLPSVLPGFQARLPREAEWEWAARAGSGKNTVASDAEARFLRPGVNGPGPIAKSRPNPFGLRDMAGNVWEWCENGYAPAQYFFPDKKPGNAAEYAVRGGSWANEKETVPPYARGSQPPSWCTPYLGFRVLLGRVTNGSGRD